MTESDAIRMASDFVAVNKIVVDSLQGSHYVTLPIVDETSIPSDIRETYLSVKSGFRNYWAVRFRQAIPSGTVESTETETICVYENGEVIHQLSL